MDQTRPSLIAFLIGLSQCEVEVSLLQDFFQHVAPTAILGAYSQRTDSSETTAHPQQLKKCICLWAISDKGWLECLNGHRTLASPPTLAKW